MNIHAVDDLIRDQSLLANCTVKERDRRQCPVMITTNSATCYYFSTTTMSSLAAIRRLPLFMAYCPDASGVLAKRLEVRQEHLKRWAQDRESGRGCTSAPLYSVQSDSFFLPSSDAPLLLNISLSDSLRYPRRFVDM